MQKMLNSNRTTKLGQKFLYSLGSQKGSTLVDDAKLNQRQYSVTKQQADKSPILDPSPKKKIESSAKKPSQFKIKDR